MTTFSSEYIAYIRSARWQEKRQSALARAGYRCAWCGSHSRLEVHHRSYARLGHERDSDLLVLCHFHHAIVTWVTRVWRWLWSGK